MFRLSQLFVVFAYLLTEAYACDTPERIAVGMGHCDLTCSDICGAYPECNGERAQCSYVEDTPGGWSCPDTCTSPCVGTGGGHVITDQCVLY